jgi:hypothetical protein
MARPRITFKALGWASDLNHTGAAGRVHDLHRWQPDKIATSGAQLRKITFFIAWIPRQIIIGVELQRIDEDGSRDRIRASGARRPKQRKMAIMQGAHGRHQAQAAAIGPQRRAGGP